MAKILLVEDDEPLALTIQKSLSVEHYTVEIAATGPDGLAQLQGAAFDLAIVDWNLPGIDGVTVCERFRSEGGNTPILMLTGRSSIEEKTKGFGSGADDYLTKPFSMLELSARVRALLRRPPILMPRILQVRDIQLDPENFTVWKSGNKVQLMPIDCALLEFFMRNPNQTFSQESLLQRVWQDDVVATSESLRSSVKRIRQKLDPPEGDSIIETLPRRGYRLVGD